MLKKALLILAAGLLTACSMYTVDEEDQEETSQEEASQEDGSQGEGQDSEEDSNDLAFVLQESDRLAQVSPFNDDALAFLSEQVEADEDGEIGEVGELTLDYSGIYLSAEEELYGVYLLTNRLNLDMTNLSFEVTHYNSAGQAVLEDYPLYLGKDMFGVLEQGTAMPVYIELPLDDTEAIEGEGFQEGEITLANLNFDTEEDLIDGLEEEEVADDDQEEEVDDQEDQTPEGYNVGYNPTYVMTVRQQEELLADIESGDVPDLAVTTPPIIANDPQGDDIMAMVQDENIVNPAAGFSLDGQLTLYWTGIATGNYETTIFMLANRTDQAYSDFDLTLDFANSDDQVILDQEEIHLSAEDYGEVEANSLTPILVDIPEDSRPALERLLDPEEALAPQYELVDSPDQGGESDEGQEDDNDQEEEDQADQEADN